MGLAGGGLLRPCALAKEGLWMPAPLYKWGRLRQAPGDSHKPTKSFCDLADSHVVADCHLIFRIEKVSM